MKKLILALLLVSIQFTAWNQCNVVATAMPQPATCPGACDGSIVYVYQNTNLSSPGSPYIVILEDGSGNTLSIQTYITEITTIPFTNLCADNYTITVQGTSCSYTVFTTVTEPADMILNMNTTDPSFGLNNGSAEIFVTNGSAPYLYSIDGGTSFQSTNLFTNLSPGTYPVVVIDANGCEQTSSFTLTDASVCSLVATANPTGMVSCYGACNGGLYYAYFDSNNDGPYQVELILDNNTVQTATNASSSGSGTFTNLCAGIYTVEVTSSQGCTGLYFITITEPSQLQVTSVATSNATSGLNNGTATITATGGWPVYTYSIDGTTFQPGNSFTNLAAGVYIAYVKDNAGCISVFTFVIQEDPGCFFNLNTITNATSCAWTCDGEVNYIFAGSPTDPPFYIVLEDSAGATIASTTSPNQTVSSSFTGLCAGSYTLTVSNSSGCAEVNNFTITSPSQLITNGSSTPATTGNSDGSLIINASGGTAPYQYSIDNQITWQSGNSFTGLSAGVYIIYVQDANGCISIITVLVDETSACNFFLFATASSNTCAYSCDGTIIYTFNDAMNNPPYTIELISGGTVQSTGTTMSNGGSGTFVNLCEGIYTIEITDADGCTDQMDVYVDAPDYLTVTSVDVTNASAGNSDGIAQVNITGGTAPYQFSFDGGATWSSTNPITGLAAGFYVMHVADANGCTVIYCFVVNEDPGCTINTTLFPASSISCYGACDGSLNYAYTDAGNNPPYTVTLNFNGSLYSTSTQTSNSFSGNFSSLCEGNYSITVTDGSGCSSFASNYTLIAPDQIDISVSVTDASTANNNGVAVITASGGSGQYAYSLDGVNFQSSHVFDTLSAGIYVVYVEDENGCTEMFTFMVNENSSCNIVLTAFNTTGVGCAGSCSAAIGFAFNDVNNNPPYTVTLSNSMGGVTTQVFSTGNGGSGSFTNVCADIYIMSVTDADGCTSYYTIEVIEPDFMTVGGSQINATSGNSDGSITLNVNGGTAPYQYSIDNQVTWQTSNVFSNLGAGFYIIYVKDANGCTQIICFVLDDSNVLGDQKIEQMNHIVYPNPTSDYIFIQVTDLQNISVYNAAGQLVETAQTISANGTTLNLESLADGVYLLELNTTNGESYKTRIIKQ